MSNKSKGRVNILEPPKILNQFELHDKMINKSSPYMDAMQGIFYNTELSNTFFSKENIQIIQNGIRAGVYKKSKNTFIIDEQNVDTIKIIMRSIFLQHAINSPDNIKEQIERLNKLVFEFAIPKVYNEAIGYIKYCKDASTIPDPLPPPIMSKLNEKQLEPNIWL